MDLDDPQPYRAPAWLPGGHLQTVYPLLIEPDDHPYRRERWETPDGDFIDLDWNAHVPPPAEPGADPATGPAPSSTSLRNPLLILFHGLEGSSGSPYARALMHALTASGWGGGVVHFRGCSGEANRLPRAYHSGDSAEIDWVLRRVRAAHPDRPLYAVGVSLGGNVLLKWLGERGAEARTLVRAAAAVSVPFDLTASGHQLARGLNRLYTRHFLATLKPRSLAKLRRFPGLFDERRLQRATTLHDFDNAVTAPLHGFANADDYWQRASSKPWLRTIEVPTLLVNARNDPFLPAQALPGADEVAPAVRLDFSAEGGHVGFVSGDWPGHLDWLPRRLMHFLRHAP